VFSPPHLRYGEEAKAVDGAIDGVFFPSVLGRPVALPHCCSAHFAEALVILATQGGLGSNVGI
jgi:hypothetical protein